MAGYPEYIFPSCVKNTKKEKEMPKTLFIMLYTFFWIIFLDFEFYKDKIILTSVFINVILLFSFYNYI